MAAFDYIALDGKGRKRKGVIEADSARQTRQLLRERSLTPISVTEAVKGGKKTVDTMASRWRERKVGLRDVSLITRQIATLIDSGLAVEAALGALVRQSDKPAVKSMLAAVRSQVVEGRGLAESLGAYPSSFSDMYRASVYAGERTGHLGMVLLHLADYTESTLEARQRIILALMYPIILCVVSVVIIIFLLSYIMPDMIRVFAGSGHTLPMLTRSLIFVSDGIQHYGLFAVLLIAGGVVAARRALTNPETQLMVDRRLLRVPVIGGVLYQYGSARFASTLGMLQGSGVPLVQALDITAAVMRNRHLKAAVKDIARKVSEGISLSKAMDQANVFPPVLVTMTGSGEASGELGAMLVKAAAIQERDLGNRIAVMLALFEPMVLLVMGGIVLLLVLAIILPILNLNQMVK